MRSDREIKLYVETELQSDPLVPAADMAVTAKDGVAALTGFVRRYRRKRAPEIRLKPAVLPCDVLRSSTDAFRRDAAIDAEVGRSAGPTATPASAVAPADTPRRQIARAPVADRRSSAPAPASAHRC